MERRPHPSPSSATPSRVVVATYVGLCAVVASGGLSLRSLLDRSNTPRRRLPRRARPAQLPSHVQPRPRDTRFRRSFLANVDLFDVTCLVSSVCASSAPATAYARTVEPVVTVTVTVPHGRPHHLCHGSGLRLDAPLLGRTTLDPPAFHTPVAPHSLAQPRLSHPGNPQSRSSCQSR